MRYDDDTLEWIEGMDVSDLARRAGCFVPGTHDGHLFLARVRDSVLDEANHQIDADDWDRLAVQDYAGCMTDTVDNIVANRSTVSVWEAFTDLGAWNENPVDHFGLVTNDLTEIARWSLFMIADRLAHDLCEVIADTVYDDTEDVNWWRVTDGDRNEVEVIADDEDMARYMALCSNGLTTGTADTWTVEKI